MDTKNIMQSKNFEFLRKHWPELASLGGFAERYAYPDPEGALVKLRAFGECLVGGIYKTHSLPKLPMSTFMDLLKNGVFTASTPKVIQDKLHMLRLYGNKAAHGEKSTAKVSVQLVKEAYDLGRWWYITSTGGDVQNIPVYQPPLWDIESTIKFKKEKRALLEKYAKQEAQMQNLLTQLEQERQQRLDAEKTAEELQKISSKAKRVADELEFDEVTTRKFLIDNQLADVGWNLESSLNKQMDVIQEMEVEYQTTNSGKGYADYVLPDDNGKPLAVIEAKKAAVEPEKGRQQAKQYADGLEKQYGQRPVVFYTNGYDTWIWDDSQNYPPRKIYGFYSKDSLQYLVHQRQEKKPLDSLSPNPNIADRLYQ
ncbi:MAG: type I restriction enzyme HsdR N-terminal domain-containing protein, partial [SAR324 cluster bacterium]|nr:type I restriction enzyme HsdR N-terminal domain-containing protein [SAR324 cluster bacterium]